MELGCPIIALSYSKVLGCIKKKRPCSGRFKCEIDFYFAASARRCSAIFWSLIKSSNSTNLSRIPCGNISITLFATVWLIVWSCELNTSVPLKSRIPLLSAWILSRSRWLVGSSRNKRLAYCSIILLSIQRTFSPPDNTRALLNTSSPEKSILPKNPRTNTSSLFSGE